ncbi:TAD3 [Scenedesmus sp. PABB004]|nr:TAD3 [Scenedesmus sp. PABB004]
MAAAGAAALQPAALVSGRAAARLTLGEAWVAHVAPAHVGALMKALQTELPLGPLAHLKRVKPDGDGVAVLLRLRAQEEQHQQQQLHQQQSQQAQQPAQQAQQPALPPGTAALLAAGGARLGVAAVPVVPPDSKAQWAEWSRIWPMPWRVPPGAEERDGEPAPPAEQAYFARHMAAALAASAAAGGRNAALLVDPRSGAVLAQALDASDAHPLDHAAMVAVEAVAARDRALWPFNGFAHAGRHAHAPDDAGYAAVPPPQHAHAPRRGDGEELGRPPKKQRPAGGGDGGGGPAQLQEELQPLEAQLAGGGGGAADWAAKPYLCTGYDAFLAAEPCTMCAMALVHSRVARVVYCRRDAARGALGGASRLHAARSLNHHYRVYHMPLAQADGP